MDEIRKAIENQVDNVDLCDVLFLISEIVNKQSDLSIDQGEQEEANILRLSANKIEALSQEIAFMSARQD